MVQKQAVLGREIGADSFADDDPLAELARIVGYEAAPVARAAPAIAPPQPAGDAEFNLEDELLREFETYDAPELTAPALRAAEPVAVPEPVYAPEPVSAQEPLYEEPEYVPQSVYADASVAADQPYDLAEAGANAAADGVDDAYWSDEPIAGDDLSELQEWGDPSFGENTAPVAGPEPRDDAYDLADELERAVAEAPDEQAGDSWPVAEPRLTLPLANFNAPRVVQPQMAPPESNAAPAQSDFTADPAESGFRDMLEDELSAALSDTDFPAEPSELAAAPAPEPFDFDRMIADVNDFTRSAAVPAAATPYEAAAHVAAPAQPVPRAEPQFDMSFTDALEMGEQPRQANGAQSAYAIGRNAPTAASIAAPRAEPRAQPRPDAEVFDPFADGEFELALDDLELDLSELVEADNRRPAAAAPPTPEPQAYRPEPPVARPEPVPAAVLPFDPSQIAEQDELLETIGALDVPDLPVAEAKERAVFNPDYDIDIDSELAMLFEGAQSPEMNSGQQPVPAAAVPAAQPAVSRFQPGGIAPTVPVADDFDAFERALEEDFKLSLQSPQAPPRSTGRITLPKNAPLRVVEERSVPRRWLLAASVAGVVLLGAGGLYAWLSGTAGDLLNSDAPRVILADKEPVKVVPEDRGGKSVPNQDKAVYDRVQGAAAEDPTQENLISASEEPVDVVQKTLIPETVPPEGAEDGMGEATPVGETEDPRLLPGSQPSTETAAEAADANVTTITPRKVRTMIVKPDGTLVAQDMPVAEPDATAAAPSAVAPAATVPVAALPDVAAETAPSVPTAVVPAAGFPAATTTAEAAASATETAVAAPKAPVPTARPAEQPVNVVGAVTAQGNVRQPPAAAAPAPAPAATPPATAKVTAAAAPAASVTVPAGGYVIQIASLPSEAEAQKSYKNMLAKFANVIGGRGVDIKKAEIAGKGTYYRVRIPAGSKADAVALCERFRSAGGSCLVAN